MFKGVNWTITIIGGVIAYFFFSHYYDNAGGLTISRGKASPHIPPFRGPASSTIVVQ